MPSYDNTYNALLVTPRPLRYTDSAGNTYGHYRLSATSGATVSLTANDPIFSFRWTASNANAILHRVTVAASIGANITTVVPFPLEAVVARAFTASDSAGTAITPSTGQKGRTTMGSSLLGDCRIATTGKLTAGTRTLDSYGFGSTWLSFQPTVTNAGAGSFPADLYRAEIPNEVPVTLSANEGFIIRVPVATNTSGSVAYTFTVAWAEVPASSTL